ncbi:MAG: 16S rRNA (cytosine(1402)-N(4))-methyltransferase RsmH [Clostridiales bacterium]|jgi:16S rRNA (cytosine1402-N4)-methyltransferase|nr:16S rRNA (cytosine(1402)-N(4))-methyltransferase RsmH [Clostridiales bacterium]
MTNAMQQYHIPVLLNECIESLNILPSGLYFDGTLGGGGHSEAMLRRGARIIATDLDGEAIDFALDRFSRVSAYAGRYALIKGNFKDALQIFSDRGITRIDGAVLDLGVSSRQIDDPERGFSYARDGRLDMRMNRDGFVSALTIVNEYAEDELARIIFTYGEERAARKIAAAIVKRRAERPVETTAELAGIVRECVPFSGANGHPAKKTFQAIRIETNGELAGLCEALSDIFGVIRSGGRLAVIAFHSLEDRLVKRTFKNFATDCVCDKSFPVCVCGHKASGKLLFSKGVKPSKEEQNGNPRSKSATLRVIEKL